MVGAWSSCLIWWIWRRSFSLAKRSNPLEASSKMIRSGWSMRLRAMRTVCFSPWESSRYLRPIKELAPIEVSISRAQFSSSSPYAVYKILLLYWPVRTICSVKRCSGSLSEIKELTIPIRFRNSGIPPSPKRVPRTVTWPELAQYSDMSSLRRVDFPTPFKPKMAQHSFSFTCQLISFKRAFPLRIKLTSCSSIKLFITSSFWLKSPLFYHKIW